MRRPFVTVALLAAAALIATAAPASSSKAAPPVIGCEARAEPSIDRFERERDVVRLREDGAMRDDVTIPPLPAPLSWEVAPVSWSLEEGPLLTIAAPPRSDLFSDPSGGEPMDAAPRLLAPVDGDFQLSARVRCTFAGTFDAGALLLWAHAQRWVKLAFEVSPQGEPMVVSVVTDGRSDDANAFVVDDEAVWLRVSRSGEACALHARLEGNEWRFVRHFALGAHAGLRAGFLVQSPLGEGATARFDEIGFVPERLTDLRSGA